MPRDGYKTVTVREETHTVLAATKEADPDLDSFDDFCSGSVLYYVEANELEPEFDPEAQEALETLRDK